MCVRTPGFVSTPWQDGRNSYKQELNKRFQYQLVKTSCMSLHICQCCWIWLKVRHLPLCLEFIFYHENKWTFTSIFLNIYLLLLRPEVHYNHLVWLLSNTGHRTLLSNFCSRTLTFMPFSVNSWVSASTCYSSFCSLSAQHINKVLIIQHWCSRVFNSSA